MPDFRAVSRLLGIAALCLMLMGLHSVAVRAAYDADRHCPSISEPYQNSPGTVHPASCCTKLQCCPTLIAATCDRVQAATSRLRTPLLDEANPFLLVRALYPPPKPKLS